MRFDVDANGHRHAVEARRDGRGWLVTIDGRSMTADLERAGGRWSLLLGPRDGDRGAAAKPGVGRPFRSYDVAIETRGRGERTVHVDGREIAVSFANGRNHTAAPHGVATGPLRIESPMAGRVVKVLVAAGDVVAARQGLVIVEAMKMENELRAPRAGSVREVPAREGGSVEAGAVLVVIE